MNDCMKARFADGVVANVVKFEVEDLCHGLIEGDPKCCIQHKIKEDQYKIDRGEWPSTHRFELAPKQCIILGGNGVATSTYLYNTLPTYRYNVWFEYQGKEMDIIWYDDAPPIYIGIYDVFQEKAGQVEFNKYADYFD